MSEAKRDTQFAGFADLIYEKTGNALSNADVKLIIARLAYDLVEHTVGHSLEYLHECGIELSGSMNSRITPSIPDMKESPKES